MDNGRIRIENYKDALLCDVYLDGELVKDDILWAIEEIGKSYDFPVDIIVKRTGSYSLSMDMQEMLMNGIEELLGSIALVTNDKRKKKVANYERAIFLKAYKCGVFNTVDEAYRFLKK